MNYSVFCFNNMKLTKRKGFNFFRSYFDVYNELETDSDKVAFMDALLDRQFLGIKPEGLKGMPKFAFISQTNSIDTQIKGYEDRLKSLNKNTPNYNPWGDPQQGVKKQIQTPPQQEKGKGEEKGQVQVKEEVKEKEQINNSLMSEIKISELEDFDNSLVDYFQIAEAFRLLFIKNLKEKEASTKNQENAKFKSYVTPIRLMFETEKVTKEQLTKVFKYLGSSEGEFWKPNILSTSKLRDKFNVLIMKANEKPKSNTSYEFDAQKVLNSDAAKSFSFKDLRG